MGQSSSHSRSSFQVNGTTAEFDDTSSFFKSVEDRSDEKPQTCWVYLCESKSRNKDPEWKIYLKSRLQNSDLGEWPQQLLKILREPLKSSDVTDKYEILLTYHQSKQTTINRSKFPFKTIDIELKDHSSMSCNNPQRMVASVNEPIDLSDDNIVHNDERSNWMHSSFNIRVSEARESLIESIAYLKDIKESSQPLDYAGNSQEKVNRIKRIASQYNYKYDNYTILLPNIEDSPKAQYSETDDSQKNMAKYRKIFGIIEKHFGSKKNIFRQLVNQFESYYTNHYEKILEMYRRNNISASDLKDNVAKATLDLQQFIGILYETVSLYYDFEKLRKEGQTGLRNLLNRDNVINFVTSSIFSEDIYTTLFDLYCTEDQQLEKMYNKKVLLCQQMAPENFSVSEDLCLNEKTIEYFKNKGWLTGNNQLQKSPKNFSPKESESRETTITLKSQNSQLQKEVYFDQSVIGELSLQYEGDNEPYHKAIMVLQDLQHQRSPIHKLKNIVKTAELIPKCIDEFYKAHNISHKKRLDADETFSIFLYIVAKSGIRDVAAHYKIIERFTTNNILSSIAGYYATTLGACMACISDMSFPDEPNFVDFNNEIRNFMKSSKIGESVSSESSVIFAPKQLY